MALSYLGLAFCGVGTSNFYPLALSIALASAGGQASKATSIAAVGFGLASFSAPLLLGRLADAFDLSKAFWAVPIGLATMAILLLLERRHTGKLAPIAVSGAPRSPFQAPRQEDKGGQ